MWDLARAVTQGVLTKLCWTSLEITLLFKKAYCVTFVKKSKLLEV